MKHPAFTLFLVALLGLAGQAQQPNSSAATLTVNGTNGPPYPIIGAGIIGGNTGTIYITGTPGVPFILTHAADLRSPGLSVLGGLVDLEMTSMEVVLDGINRVPWLASTDATGAWSVTHTVPTGISTGTTRAYQAALTDPSSSTGVTLTAATKVTFTQGPQTFTISGLGANGATLFNLQSHGFSFPFYAQTWNSFYVNANGHVTFGQSDGDFTATASEMHAGPPRVSGFWTDLDPGSIGTVTVTIDTSVPGLEKAIVHFDNVTGRNFGTGVPPTHTFTMTMMAVGDVNLSYDPFNGPSFYDTVCGITPGNGTSPPPGNQSQDLSQILNSGGIITGPGEGLFEFFVGTASLTPGTNFWDLSGLANGMTYQAIGAGMSGTQYSFF